MQKIRVACIQMTSGSVMADNLDQAELWIRKAVAQGARFVATPEVTCARMADAKAQTAAAPGFAEHPGVARFAGLARDLGVWILAGSFLIKTDSGKCFNRSVLFSADGSVAAHYDKIHLFDVDLPGGEAYRESDTILPGDRAVLAATPWGGVGLSVCYDIRFSALYVALARAGARILTIPAAFTVPTGQAHWEILVRARAIETGSFVLAPAQVGSAGGARPTWGHSLIVGPWGEILAQADGATPGLIVADLDLATVARAREAIPVLRSAGEFFEVDKVGSLNLS
jgi:predicted amidohydrolase